MIKTETSTFVGFAADRKPLPMKRVEAKIKKIFLVFTLGGNVIQLFFSQSCESSGTRRSHGGAKV